MKSYEASIGKTLNKLFGYVNYVRGIIETSRSLIVNNITGFHNIIKQIKSDIQNVFQLDNLLAIKTDIEQSIAAEFNKLKEKLANMKALSFESVKSFLSDYAVALINLLKSGYEKLAVSAPIVADQITNNVKTFTSRFGDNLKLLMSSATKTASGILSAVKGQTSYSESGVIKGSLDLNLAKEAQSAIDSI